MKNVVNTKDWKEEYDKCVASPYYFATTYLTVNGMPFTTMLSQKVFDDSIKILDKKYEKLWSLIEETIKDREERRIKIGRVFIVIRKSGDTTWIYYGSKIYDTSGMGDIDTLYELTVGRKEEIIAYLNKKNNG